MADNAFPVVRSLRRLGRFAVAMVATAAFLAGGAAALLLMSLTGYVLPQLAFLAACGCAVGALLLFERFDLLPDDPSEPPTTVCYPGAAPGRPRAGRLAA